MEHNEVRIKSIVDWVFPLYGNIHCMPYGTLQVTDGVDTKICKTKGDRWDDHDDYQYITFKRKRYKVVGESNHRTLSVNIHLEPIK